MACYDGCMNFSAGEYEITVGRDSGSSEYIALAEEFPSLSWVSDSYIGALQGMEALIDETLEDLRAAGECPPYPISRGYY